MGAELMARGDSDMHGSCLVFWILNEHMGQGPWVQGIQKCCAMASLAS